MIVADTSAWIDYFNGVEAIHTDRFDKELDSGNVLVGDQIMAEFRESVFRSFLYGKGTAFFLTLLQEPGYSLR